MCPLGTNKVSVAKKEICRWGVRWKTNSHLQREGRRKTSTDYTETRRVNKYLPVFIHIPMTWPKSQSTYTTPQLGSGISSQVPGRVGTNA